MVHLTGLESSGFWFVAIAMFLSGGLVMLWREETRPRLHAERPDDCR
ncbi:Mg2+ and Co2+ transporter CorA [Marinobacterium sp. MBR-111]